MGTLTITNSSFNNMNSIMGTIFNQGELIISDSNISNSISNNLAHSITNIGNCSIIKSKLTNNINYNDNSLPVVYNYYNLNIENSNLGTIESNNKYDELLFKSGEVNIKNSTLYSLNLENATVNIYNSEITGRTSFRNSNINISESLFSQNSDFIGLTIHYCNITAFHTIFDMDISSGYTNYNITYSVILKSMYGGGKYDFLYAPYNWWGVNSGPSLSYFKNYNISYWAIANFEYENNTIPINPNGKFITSLNKWTDGVNIFEFSENESLPIRYVKFESQSGNFLYSKQKLDKISINYLIGNNLDGKVYAIIDKQRLMLNIGNSISDYTYFVSPTGHDGPEDGTYENPFLTLDYAISKAGNGNTICILGGINKHLGNSNLQITKNLTIIGLENTILVQHNSYIFNIPEWGSLKIKNIKFIVENQEYSNPMFTVSGGYLNIVNCSVTNIKSPGLITTNGGIENSGQVIIEDSLFSNIIGSAIIGSAKTFIINSSFEKFSNYYNYRGVESYNCIFPVTNSIEIYDSIFKNNNVGVINLHPFTYSGSSLLGAKASDYAEEYGFYAYIENSIFESNVFYNINNEYASSGAGLLIHDNYGSYRGFINNCSFINNKGTICIADNVNNSIFTDNNGQTYAGSGLVRGEFINNSIFIKNTNLYKNGDNAFIGEGIATANLILNSVFMDNRAAFGGAVSNSKEIHYSAFINNTAVYSGDDVYSASDDVDYSTNWWSDNQKPDSSKIFKFLGTLTLNDWIIMSLEYTSNKEIKASLNHCIDENGNIKEFSNILSRPVEFMVDNGEISPEYTQLKNGVVYAILNCNLNSDFKVYAKIDNQLLEVNIRNTHTQLIMDDISFKGKDNTYSVRLINVNGYKISNQTLIVEIINENDEKQVFSVVSDEDGNAKFNVDYPVGIYKVNINYWGNAYFEKCNASKTIEIVVSPTYLISYNHTYYGKTNKFSAILSGENDKKLDNFTLTYNIINSKGKSVLINVNTDSYGVGEAILNLDTGEYTIICNFLGDLWYAPSSSISKILVYPVNTTINTPNVTFYGENNIYKISLKDVYGSPISGENIFVTISQDDLADKFTLTTNDEGIASLTINYLPGNYNLTAEFLGDEVYGYSNSNGTIKVEKVLTLISGFSYATLPINGVYSVVLKDMYGHRIVNEKINLNVYQGKLLKEYSSISDGTGEAIFKLDLNEGTYLVTMDYDGNTWYSDSTNAATIIISNNVVLEDIYINGTDLVQYYGENKYFIIEFNDPNAYNQYGKTIIATISSSDWSKSYELYTDIFGLTRLQINLNPGEYNIIYKYSNEHYNIFGAGTNKISIYKTPTRIFANDLIMNVDETRIFEINLRDINNAPIKNMQVNVDIDGKLQNITTNSEGIAKLLVNLDIGNHTINYSINNPNYLTSQGSSRILVVDTDKTSSKLITDDITGLDNETTDITIKLTDILDNGISSSEISIQIYTVDGELILNKTDNTDNNGKYTLKVNLDYGNYIFKTIYKGNNFYLESSSTNMINIESSDNKTKTLMFNGDTELFNSTDYYIVLSDINGTILKDYEVKFFVGDNEYLTKTDNTGRAYLGLNLEPDVYIVKSIFNGDTDYKQASSLSKIFVSGVYTQLYTNPLVKYYKNGTQFHVKLMNHLNNPISGKIISVLLENSIYNCTTDEDGWISLNIDLNPGFYDVECYYYGDSSFENSFTKTNITVLPTISGKDEIKYFGDSPYLNISFVYGSGKAINNTAFIISIDGTNYYALTNDDGIFYFESNLNSGHHIIIVNNPYDGLYAKYNLDILQTVNASDFVKIINTNSQYIASFLDTNGNPLKNQYVDIIINGTKYSEKTDTEGILKLDMNLNPGDYSVIIINTVTGEYIETSVKTLANPNENKNLNLNIQHITGNKNLVVYYNNRIYYKVRIIKDDGKAVDKGEIVTFKIAKKTYKIKTNNNGYAILKIKLKPKKYVITIIYNKDKVSNIITIKPRLTAKNISKKKSKIVKFSAKLVNIKGKGLKGKKIHFKIKTKKYMAKTNKKGIASIKLKLNISKYIIKTSYSKFRITNTIIIKK